MMVLASSSCLGKRKICHGPRGRYLVDGNFPESEAKGTVQATRPPKRNRPLSPTNTASLPEQQCRQHQIPNRSKKRLDYPKLPRWIRRNQDGKKDDYAGKRTASLPTYASA